MKMIFAVMSLLIVAGCGQRSGGDTVGQAAGTTSEMQGTGTTSSDPAALDSNGMARSGTSTGGAINAAAVPASETASGTTQSASSAPNMKEDSAKAVDPAAGHDDSATRKNKGIKQGSSDAVKAKMQKTRPGTEHDMTGGNDSGQGAASK